ncbi:MAG: SLBB domain-containing protein [Candidatus Wallbacteria bacterium]
MKRKLCLLLVIVFIATQVIAPGFAYAQFAIAQNEAKAPGVEGANNFFTSDANTAKTVPAAIDKNSFNSSFNNIYTRDAGGNENLNNVRVNPSFKANQARIGERANQYVGRLKPGSFANYKATDEINVEKINNLTNGNKQDEQFYNLDELYKVKTFADYNREFFKEDVTKQETISKVQDINLDLEPFGYKIFENSQNLNFSPIMNVAAPDDYVVGPGDGLIIHVWNKLMDESFAVETTREGKVNIPKIGEVYIWGLKFKDVEKVIEREISKLFSDCKVSVSLGKIRSIDVFIAGEVSNPGTYTIPALSTVLNGLMMAGGPTKNGSLRKIILRRGSEEKVIDLYKFLLYGDRADDLRLNSQDTIFVPIIGDTAGIAGNVKRPGIYEIIKGSEIAELIRMAGGITAKGYLSNVQLIRTVNNEKRVIMDVKANEKSGVIIKDGDLVKVFSIFNKASNFFNIEGNIERPGSYQFVEGMRVSDALKCGGTILSGTFMEKAELRRVITEGKAYNYSQTQQTTDAGYELIYVNIGEVLAGNKKSDIQLKPMDTLKIFSKETVRPQPKIAVSGAIFKPGIYDLAAKMRVRDAIFLAGNIMPEAFLERAEIVRRVPVIKKEVTALKEIIQTKTGEVILAPAVLKTAEVAVGTAEIKSVSKLETLKNKLKEQMAKKNKKESSVKAAVIEEDNIKKTQAAPEEEKIKNDAVLIQKQTDSKEKFENYEHKVITINLRKAMEGDPEENIMLENFDQINILKVSEGVANNSVEVIGEVKYPGNFIIKRGERLSSLLERTGGFTKDAFLNGVIFTRKSVQERQQENIKKLVSEAREKIKETSAMLAKNAENAEQVKQEREALQVQEKEIEKIAEEMPKGRITIMLSDLVNNKNSVMDIELEDGDKLYIPRTPSDVAILGEVYNPGAVIFRPDTKLETYLEWMGGYTRNADKSRIYVVKADGTTISKTAFLKHRTILNFRYEKSSEEAKQAMKYDKFEDILIERGDTIYVPTAVKVYRNETKEIIDLVYKLTLTFAGIKAAFK